MPDDLDIWRAAALYLKQHGDEAEFVVAQRVDALLEAGDTQGFTVLNRGLKAVRELPRRKRGPGEAPHYPAAPASRHGCPAPEPSCARDLSMGGLAVAFAEARWPRRVPGQR
jgi:hypothetical protein